MRATTAEGLDPRAIQRAFHHGTDGARMGEWPTGRVHAEEHLLLNGVMLGRTVTAPDGSVIHIIASSLVPLPQPAMEMAEKSS